VPLLVCRAFPSATAGATYSSIARCVDLCIGVGYCCLRCRTARGACSFAGAALAAGPRHACATRAPPCPPGMPPLAASEQPPGPAALLRLPACRTPPVPAASPGSACLRWLPVTQAGARVISMSLEGPYSPIWEWMAEAAQSAGALLVAAAGNSERFGFPLCLGAGGRQPTGRREAASSILAVCVARVPLRQTARSPQPPPAARSARGCSNIRPSGHQPRRRGRLHRPGAQLP
jgi:hypothetical protein